MTEILSLRLLVESRLDEMAARRLSAECGFDVDAVYGKKGWQSVQKQVRAFTAAAEFAPCLAMVDFMDTGMQCPPGVIAEWTPRMHPNLVFRVVVRELESWLLADRQGIAKFLHVPLNRIPMLPEQECDPKQTLIRIAARSQSPRVKQSLVPRDGPSAKVGPDYNAEMEQFILHQWNPAAARTAAPSLDRCLRRLSEAAKRLRGS